MATLKPEQAIRIADEPLPPPVRALFVMPLGSQRGGAELMLLHLLECRREARVEPTVALLQPGPLADWCATRGIPTVTIDAGRMRQPRMVGRTVRALIRLANETRADVIVGWMSKAQIYGGIAAIGAGLPSVWLQAGLPGGLAAWDRAATLVPARLIVALSRGVDHAQQKLWPHRRTTVVYPAVDIRRFDADRIGDVRAMRRRLGLPEDSLVFGSVGRLDRWKGFHVLLAAVPTILERHPDATFVLVGGPHEFDPAYADELTEQARRIGRDRQVLLVGQQSNPEEWMQAMDVFVHTSQNEPFGMVVIEAMALGKAVVAGAEGGPTEVITPGIDGLLSPYGDAPALARAILRYLDDRQLRETIGAAARRRAQDFTVERYARDFGAAIADAAGASDRWPPSPQRQQPPVAEPPDAR